MKVVVSSSGRDLDSKVDFRFGRCPYFIVVETDDLSYEVMENEASREFGGAGIKSAQKIIESGAKYVITGNVGPNAFRVLSSAGIRIFSAGNMSIREAIEKFKKGELEEIKTATSPAHFGMR